MASFAEPIKEEAGLKLMRKVVDDPSSLKPGHHIYCYKRFGCYTHHGIHVGGGKVIHFTRTHDKEAFLPSLLPDAELEVGNPCEKCTHIIQSLGLGNECARGVIITCLDCFRRDGSKLQPIHLYAYGVRRLWFLLKVSGSCTTIAVDKSLAEAVDLAYELLHNRTFGNYNLLFNNCEHFATLCHTEIRISEQTIFWTRCWIRMCQLRSFCSTMRRFLVKMLRPIEGELSNFEVG